MKIELTPLVSLLFSARRSPSTMTSRRRRAGWLSGVGPPQLLANLEQHLGLRNRRMRCRAGAALSRRMAELEVTRPGRFYARSYALDPIGTATTLSDGATSS